MNKIICLFILFIEKYKLKPIQTCKRRYLCNVIIVFFNIVILSILELC